MCGNIYVSIVCVKFGVTILNWSEPMYITTYTTVQYLDSNVSLCTYWSDKRGILGAESSPVAKYSLLFILMQ